MAVPAHLSRRRSTDISAIQGIESDDPLPLSSLLERDACARVFTSWRDHGRVAADGFDAAALATRSRQHDRSGPSP